MKLLIKNGHVIDLVNDLSEQMDILINDGKIQKIAKNIDADECMTIDARNKIVCPGFIDTHVHLREPGYEYKEDIYSGTRAAAVGGFTTVCCMPNTSPVIDNAAVATFVRERAAKCGAVNVLPIGSITKQQAGLELSPMAELKAAGCIGVSDDGKPVSNPALMRNAMEYAKMFDFPIMSHCEATSLSKDGQMHEGFYSTIYGLKGIPTLAEDLMVARDLMLAEYTGAHIHICHISTMGSVELIRQAKSKGIRVSCEATPHHLVLSDEAVGTYDPDTKVNPPLRSIDHIQALQQALADGTIDCIATDHAPHHKDSKDCEYAMASFGISGLETAVPLIMDQLVHQGLLTVEQMVEKFTRGPAEVLGISKGSLDIGADADITVIDPELEKVVDPAKFYSKGKNTPFKGWRLKGWPILTIVGGKIVAKDGNIE